jgi:hypothetical protein
MPTGLNQRAFFPVRYETEYAVSAMSAKYIIAGVAACFAFAYASDVLVAQKKVFGGKGHRSTDDLKLSPQSTSIILTLTSVLLTW